MKPAAFCFPASVFLPKQFSLWRILNCLFLLVVFWILHQRKFPGSISYFLSQKFNNFIFSISIYYDFGVMILHEVWHGSQNSAIDINSQILLTIITWWKHHIEQLPMYYLKGRLFQCTLSTFDLILWCLMHVSAFHQYHAALGIVCL